MFGNMTIMAKEILTGNYEGEGRNKIFILVSNFIKSTIFINLKNFNKNSTENLRFNEYVYLLIFLLNTISTMTIKKELQYDVYTFMTYAIIISFLVSVLSFRVYKRYTPELTDEDFIVYVLGIVILKTLTLIIQAYLLKTFNVFFIGTILAFAINSLVVSCIASKIINVNKILF